MHGWKKSIFQWIGFEGFK